MAMPSQSESDVPCARIRWATAANLPGSCDLAAVSRPLSGPAPIYLCHHSCGAAYICASRAALPALRSAASTEGSATFTRWHMGCLTERMIVSYLGTKGGTGTTTLAVNCAADIRRLTEADQSSSTSRTAREMCRCSSGSGPATRCCTPSTTLPG